MRWLVASGRDPVVVGNRTRVKVTKNKLAPPFREVEFDILYGEGFSREGELIDLGVEHGLVDKAGAWYSYNGDRIGQGRDKVREFLKQNSKMAVEIDTALRAKLLPSKDSASSTEDEPEALEAEA